MSLSALQEQWIQLYDELGGSFDSQVLAAPFVSVLEDPSEAASARKILLVGKATAGGWDNVHFDSTKNQPLTARLQERRCFTLKQLKEIGNGDQNPSAFWRFRERLEQISSQVVWTNLVKIGFENDNPSLPFIQRQKELAQRTLRAEMEEYKPALVALVTNKFAANEIAHPVFGHRDSWEQPTDSMWFKRATQTEPAMLWVDHPQMKLKDEVDCWLDKAQDLVR